MICGMIWCITMLRKELIKVLIEEKRRNISTTWHEDYAGDAHEGNGGDAHEGNDEDVYERHAEEVHENRSCCAVSSGRRLQLYNRSSFSSGGHNSEKGEADALFNVSLQPYNNTSLPVSNENISMSGNEYSFFDRAVKWKQSKEAEYARTREELLDNELSGCTFRPLINTNKSYKPPSTPVVARLYSDSKAKLREWEHEKKRKEDEEINRTCTFKPQTNTRPPTPTKTRTSAGSQVPHKDKENSPKFSFTPTTNKVPTQMVTAAQYLATNAFERLSRTSGVSYKPDDPLTKSPAQGNPNPPHSVKPRPSSAPPGGRPNSGNVTTQKSFNVFLARQQDHLTKKQYKMEYMARNDGVPAQPVLCNHSKQLLKQKQMGSFLERLAKDVEKDKPHTLLQSDDECTFQPKILPSSRMRKPRSVEELSVGDKLKHDAHIEEMRQKMEDDETRHATFRPRTTNYPTESRLRILTEPETYLERIQKDKDIKEEQYIEWLQQQERQKLEGCTFQPEIHDAPQYIKRIARSMVLARGNKPRTSISPPTKPEWL